MDIVTEAPRVLSRHGQPRAKQDHDGDPIAHEQGNGACVVTVFCEDKKYLSTDLRSDEECKEHYRVNEVQPLDSPVIPPAANSLQTISLALLKVFFFEWFSTTKRRR